MHLLLMIPLTFVTPVMASEPSGASPGLSKLDGLYLGAGLEYSKNADGHEVPARELTESEVQLTLYIRYAPDWNSSIRPYAQLVYKSAGRPTDHFKSHISDIGKNNREIVEDIFDQYSWRLNILDLRAGIETNITEASFVRAGLLVNHTDEQGMVDLLVDKFGALPWYSTQTRLGAFGSVGKNFDLGPIQVESSLVLSHYIPHSIGGKGLFETCNDSEKWTDFLYLLKEAPEECARDQADFLSGRTIFSVDNYINVGAIAISTTFFYGWYHSSKVRQEWIETEAQRPGAGTFEVDSSTYGAMLTLGYQFGH